MKFLSVLIDLYQQNELIVKKYQYLSGIELYRNAIHHQNISHQHFIFETLMNHHEIITRMNKENSVFNENYIYAIASEFGNEQCFQWARKKNYSWNQNTCAWIAEYGRLNWLQYAYEHGCPKSYETCMCAASNGHLDCLKFAHEHKFPWDEETCVWAAENGHLECLQYAHEHGCPWDKWTCQFAAGNGHLNCLQYACEHNCPCDGYVFFWAARYGFLDCLRYGFEQGYFIDIALCLEKTQHSHIREYLLSLQ